MAVRNRNMTERVALAGNKIAAIMKKALRGRLAEDEFIEDAIHYVQVAVRCALFGGQNYKRLKAAAKVADKKGRISALFNEDQLKEMLVFCEKIEDLPDGSSVEKYMEKVNDLVSEIKKRGEVPSMHSLRLRKEHVGMRCYFKVGKEFVSAVVIPPATKHAEVPSILVTSGVHAGKAAKSPTAMIRHIDPEGEASKNIYDSIRCDPVNKVDLASLREAIEKSVDIKPKKGVDNWYDYYCEDQYAGPDINVDKPSAEEIGDMMTLRECCGWGIPRFSDPQPKPTQGELDFSQEEARPEDQDSNVVQNDDAEGLLSVEGALELATRDLTSRAEVKRLKELHDEALNESKLARRELNQAYKTISDERDEIRSRIRQAADEYADGEIPVNEYVELVKKNDDRLEECKEIIATLSSVYSHPGQVPKKKKALKTKPKTLRARAEEVESKQ